MIKLKRIIVLPVMALAMASCQKEKAEDVLNPTGDKNSERSTITMFQNNIGPVPGSFTQKVLLENITGATYSKCPLNDYAIQSAQAQYPGRIIVSSFHKGDGMQTIGTSSLLNFISNGTTPYIPALAMNRVVYGNKMFNDDMTWSNNLNMAMSSVSHCGLALQSGLQPNLLSVKVHVGFNASMTGNYKLCVYLVEDGVQGSGSSFDQTNAYNTVSGNPFYGSGNPIPNYVHNNVLRAMLTPLSGTVIPSSYLVNGGHMIQSYQMDFPPNYSANSCYIVAYVYDTANLRVINVQEAKIGTAQNWD